MKTEEEKLKEVQAALDRVRAQISSYEGGDRPMSPPVALLREERRLLTLRDWYRKNP
jgi:hypothetical protein